MANNKTKPAGWKIRRLIFLYFLLGAGFVHADMVMDHTGRKVRVPDDPVRVVSLAPSITEIVYSLNCEQRLVGATQYSDYPAEAGNLPSVGSYVYLDLEKIVSLKPDLCIAIKDGNPLRIIRRLEEMNIAVYAVNPRDLDSVMKTISDIGKILGTEQRAGEVVSDMDQRMAAVSKKVDSVSHRPGVFFEIGVDPIVSAGSNTFINELIQKAGGCNLAGGHPGYPRYSVEDVLALAPEIIIVTSMDRQKVFDRVLQQWQQWEELPAVADDRIHLVDSNLYDRPSPRLVKGLEELARLLHPQLFDSDGDRAR
ncbi:iron complex transport system substrate-binding protein [Desulfosalsimonas propionicica]|uniref:Iron complex transport system substrate-binding protein n=1 Tax=Desulfosalsimonas propionicica TaxID=332175 RepID=A0A7W0C7W6_9BACT|nr:cobalamin-binding protein [Desulfosalsimonas propionicica]MBA2880762.1 iron complex transport system substrate-binding protein [Desulfosalsimonas propionicica]